MSVGWRLRFQVLEGMTCHVEVEVTWEQHKLPGGLDFHLMKRGTLGDEWT